MTRTFLENPMPILEGKKAIIWTNIRIYIKHSTAKSFSHQSWEIFTVIL